MIYFVRATSSGLIKIGYTGGDPLARMADLQTGSPERLELFAVIEGDQKFEAELHKEFARSRSHGEWFKPSRGLLGFIAIRAADPPHDNAPGEAAYQRGYKDALKRAIRILNANDMDSKRAGASIASAILILELGPTETKTRTAFEQYLARNLAAMYPHKGWPDFPDPGRELYSTDSVLGGFLLQPHRLHALLTQLHKEDPFYDRPPDPDPDDDF